MAKQHSMQRSTSDSNLGDKTTSISIPAFRDTPVSFSEFDPIGRESKKKELAKAKIVVFTPEKADVAVKQITSSSKLIISYLETIKKAEASISSALQTIAAKEKSIQREQEVIDTYLPFLAGLIQKHTALEREVQTLKQQQVSMLPSLSQKPKVFEEESHTSQPQSSTLSLLTQKLEMLAGEVHTLKQQHLQPPTLFLGSPMLRSQEKEKTLSKIPKLSSFTSYSPTTYTPKFSGSELQATKSKVSHQQKPLMIVREENTLCVPTVAFSEVSSISSSSVLDPIESFSAAGSSILGEASASHPDIPVETAS